MIEFIMKLHGIEVDRDMVTHRAALELLAGAITGLVPNPVAAQTQINSAMEAIKGGQTITIDNPGNGMSFIFQIPRKNNSVNR